MKIARKLFLFGNTPAKDAFIQNLLATNISFELIEIKNTFAAVCLHMSKAFLKCSNYLKHGSNSAVADNIIES